MSDVNHVVVTGRLTADANAREVGTSTVFDFSIAVNHYDKKESKEVADFFNVKVWAASPKQAEFYKGALVKGSAIVTDGRLSQESWQGQDGQKKSRVVILSNSVTPMGSHRGGESSDSGFPTE